MTIFPRDADGRAIVKPFERCWCSGCNRHGSRTYRHLVAPSTRPLFVCVVGPRAGTVAQDKGSASHETLDTHRHPLDW
jgi:hypothetical protein